MNRAGLSFIVLVAALAAACAGSDAVGSSPTAPSSPTPPSSTPQPPQSGCLPGAATNLRVTTSGGSNRTLMWNAGANVVDYMVEIGSTSGARDLVNTNTTHTDYAWNGVSAGTYYARVHSRNSCGQGLPSNELVFN